ncbi:hypothetical protein L228DRAFT_242499 [Xylona heveae TC161]|uniref:Uncharacterized protein n=1 Tax=Xylona heveae (strain CBS 132557 / TC161) TaxID=1328760 RepID=A0A165JDE9_XYLHT|nr:hypothetical protein L228DRAFT_242499 [Xylona heveae TC161]KZF26091.1 hypothetical protein L228DRAFT_242499 [Xylona heveae TC161]
MALEAAAAAAAAVGASFSGSGQCLHHLQDHTYPFSPSPFCFFTLTGTPSRLITPLWAPVALQHSSSSHSLIQ